MLNYCSDNIMFAMQNSDTVFVKGIPLCATYRDLDRLFSSYGPCSIVTTPLSTRQIFISLMVEFCQGNQDAVCGFLQRNHYLDRLNLSLDKLMEDNFSWEDWAKKRLELACLFAQIKYENLRDAKDAREALGVGKMCIRGAKLSL